MHVLESCSGSVEDEIGWQEKVKEILKGDGKGLKWMEEMDDRKKKKRQGDHENMERKVCE